MIMNFYSACGPVLALLLSGFSRWGRMKHCVNGLTLGYQAREYFGIITRLFYTDLALFFHWYTHVWYLRYISLFSTRSFSWALNHIYPGLKERKDNIVYLAIIYRWLSLHPWLSNWSRLFRIWDIFDWRRKTFYYILFKTKTN